MDGYLSKLERLKQEQQSFSKERFTFDLGKKLISLAQLNAQELYVLFCYAKRIPDGGTYLEIGSWVGGSLMCAYEASKVSRASVIFIAIEHVVRKQLLSNTKAIPRLALISGNSDDVKDKIKDASVDLLFLDGRHTYEQVKKDLNNYWPKLKPGGGLLGHDYGHRSPGVVRAVNEKFGKAAVVPDPEISTIFRVRKGEKND